MSSKDFQPFVNFGLMYGTSPPPTKKVKIESGDSTEDTEVRYLAKISDLQLKVCRPPSVSVKNKTVQDAEAEENRQHLEEYRVVIETHLASLNRPLQSWTGHPSVYTTKEGVVHGTGVKSRTALPANHVFLSPVGEYKLSSELSDADKYYSYDTKMAAVNLFCPEDSFVRYVNSSAYTGKEGNVKIIWLRLLVGQYRKFSGLAFPALCTLRDISAGEELLAEYEVDSAPPAPQELALALLNQRGARRLEQGETASQSALGKGRQTSSKALPLSLEPVPLAGRSGDFKQRAPRSALPRLSYLSPIPPATEPVPCATFRLAEGDEASYTARGVRIRIKRGKGGDDVVQVFMT